MATAPPRMRPMIRHHVITTLNDDAKDKAAEIRDILIEWAATIPECKRFEIGVDAGINPTSGDFALIAEFDSVDDYQVYATDERHLEIITTMIAPYAASIARAQVEY